MEKKTPPENQTFYQQLGKIVGPENMKTDDRTVSRYAIDGMVPRAVAFPTGTKQVAQAVKAASEARVAIVPWGSGSGQQVGTCLSEMDIVLYLSRMKRVTDFDASNFTVQVEAGLTNAELQTQLAEHNLFFPLRPAHSETSSIGGQVATNGNGPARILYGNLRDLVLGVTVVTPAGEIVHTGGKTMKNVAGLDLCKMFIGSWGTLGVITEAVVRVYPLPEVARGFYITFASPEDAFQMIGRVLDSPLTPSAIELVDPVAGRHMDGIGARLNEGEVLLIITAEGTPGDVERHGKDITELARNHKAKSPTVLEGEEVVKAWRAYHHMHADLLASDPAMIQGKASVPISRLDDLFREVKRVGKGYGVEVGATAHGGNGILYPYFAANDEKASRIIDELKRTAAGLGGFFVVEAAPPQVRKSVQIMPPRNDYALMKRLKAEFDPHNILNPGRLLGGL